MFPHLTSEARRIMDRMFPGVASDVSWVIPREADHGDAATSIALQLAKKVGKNPKEIAASLAHELGRDASVEKVEVAGNGYVNVWLTPPALVAELVPTRQALSAKPADPSDPPVIVEYSQPNIAKPLGVHHLIGTALGQATVNLYRHAGYRVISWNYLGDWGTQFGKLSVAYERWGTKPVTDHTITELLDLYVRFHDEAGKDETLEDQGRTAFQKLEAGDQQLRAFWSHVVAVTKASLTEVYKRLHVSFDLDLGESFYEDKMKPVLEEGKKKGVFSEGEGGSMIVEFSPEKNLPPYLVLKGDGATLYSTRDLAQMRYRIDTYHPQEILICTDVAQKLHFEQLAETCRMLGWELPGFENVLFGRMRFADASMSTRKGNILNLEGVLNESVKRAAAIIQERGETIQTDDPAALAEMMGVGAVVYGILSQNRKMDLVFDWDKMLSFEGNSAPYLQYTHARARSVLRKAEGGIGEGESAAALTPHERLLIKTLLQFPSVLEDARANRMPHKLANYLYQLSQDFNAFYNTEPILKADGAKRGARLSLTDLVASVLRAGAGILAIRLPERM